MLGEYSLVLGMEWEIGRLEEEQARQREKGEIQEGPWQAWTLEEEFGTPEKESSHKEEAVVNLLKTDKDTVWDNPQWIRKN